MKIKAFEEVEYKEKIKTSQFLNDSYCIINISVNGKRQEIRYSKDGSVGISLQQAQQMLKVLGIELYEEKEINTFKEFKEFLSVNNIYYNGLEFKRVIFELAQTILMSIEEIEKEYNVKLNILRNE